MCHNRLNATKENAQDTTFLELRSLRSRSIRQSHRNSMQHYPNSLGDSKMYIHTKFVIPTTNNTGGMPGNYFCLDLRPDVKDTAIRNCTQHSVTPSCINTPNNIEDICFKHNFSYPH